MLLFSPPPCDLSPGPRPDKQPTFTSNAFSIPLWPAPRTRSHSSSLRSSTTRLSPPHKQQTTPPPPPTSTLPSTQDMPSSSSTPRSPFSPTLGSIPEALEHEPLETLDSALATPEDHQDLPDAFIPEASSLSPALLTRANSSDAIIQSPLRRNQSFTAVCRVLRQVLEADRAQRRRILRVYLKAIVFLKYLWRANERYGNVMVTTGMYMQR